MLNSDILSDSLKLLGTKPEIDLFASRLNKELPSYVSYKPDPTATAVNAFTLSWACKVVYCFPPFCVIPRVLQKISKDKARGILVVPDWPSQPWYSKLARMLTQLPILVSAREDLLIMAANPALKHWLRRTLCMIICAVSGDDSDAQDFRRQLPQSFAHHGTSWQYASYIARWKRYASKWGIHPVSPPVSQGVNFLAMLFQAGLSYSAICVARSVLSSYFECTDCQQFGEHKRVRQFIKGVFEKRPAFPKYSTTWDVNLVLEYNYRVLLSSQEVNSEKAVLQVSHASYSVILTKATDAT